MQTTIAWVSDMSIHDPLRAALWFEMTRRFPNAVLLDYSSAVEPFDLRQAAYLLLNLIPSLPERSVLLCGIKNNTVVGLKTPLHGSHDNSRHLLFRYKHIYLISPDSGLIGLLDPDFSSEARLIYYEKKEDNLFFLKNIYPEVTEKILTNQEEEVGALCPDYFRSRLMQAYKQGNVISSWLFVHDHYGNLVFNLKKNEFLKWSAGHSLRMMLPGLKGPERISDDYEDVGPGKLFALFNGSGFLEIGINGDNLFEKLFSGKLFESRLFELKIFLE